MFEQFDLALFDSKEDFIRRTQKQLSNEFEKFGYTFPEGFQDQMATTEVILGHIEFLLSQLIQEGETRFFSFLYTLDLQQSRVEALLGRKDFLQKLAYLVLERAAQKVYTKKKFSS